MRASRIRCFWMYSLIVILLTTIPYAIGFSAKEPASIFTGFVFAVEDGNSYIAKMQLGSSGDWLFRTPYSTQPQRGVLAFIPYILLGKLAAGTEVHLQLAILFHLFRAAMIPLAIWATYRFMEHFLSDDRWAAWATVMGTIGSGLGWLLVLINQTTFLGSMPLGFISPETFGFLAFLGLPHLILARAMLLIAMRLYLESPDVRGKAVRTGLTLAALGLVQPMAMIPAYAVVAIHQLLVIIRYGRIGFQTWRSRWLQPLVRIIGLSLPVFAYYAIVFSSDPFLRSWTDQNRILSPHPIHYLIAYGLLLPISLAGLFKAWSASDEHWLLPLGWVLIIPILAYAPYNLQRRLPEGSWAAIVLLAALGLSRWKINPRIRSRVRIALLVFSLMTPTLLVYGGTQVARTRTWPAFRPRSEVNAFAWLAENAHEDAIVLSAFETGNAIPAWAPVRVIIGHGPESVNLDQLERSVQAFFGGKLTTGAQEHFLQEQGVEFVFYGPIERALGDWDPMEIGSLKPVYFGDGFFHIYQYLGDT